MTDSPLTSLLLQSESSDSSDTRFPYHIELGNSMELYWHLDVPLETITFRLEASVDQDALVLFGFSAYGEATDADVIAIWTDHRGRTHFQVTSHGY